MWECGKTESEVLENEEDAEENDIIAILENEQIVITVSTSGKCQIEPVDEDEAEIISETEEISEVVVTTAYVAGEEMTAILSSSENYVTEAPLLPITVNEGESYVVQVLGTFETESGEQDVVANIGGEATTIEAEITSVEACLADCCHRRRDLCH